MMLTIKEYLGPIKVINFHAISDGLWFEKIVKYLKNKNNIITCADLEANLKGELSIKNGVLLTVDDGERSFYDIIYPIIKKHQIPMTIFVSPKITIQEENFWFQEIEGFNHLKFKKICAEILQIPLVSFLHIKVLALIKSMQIHEVQEAIEVYKSKYNVHKKPFQNLTVNELKELKSSGLVTIGAHTMTHPILLNETDEQASFEIGSSVQELSDLLNEQVKYFAYPNGIPAIDYNQREVEILKDLGIELSFSTRFTKVCKSSNKFEIPRGEISNGQFDFRKKLVLWEHWNFLATLKNKRKEHLKQRKFMLDLIRMNNA
ncbi:polysaccharide deacetylase family protein [Flavobacteriaceae bacterium F08102]|nr:polysaccharide deacetylase family protein [Flavobacteriaceae bacterium F08102]